MSANAQRIILAAAVVAFVAGLAHFLNLRFQGGDMYPDYSTFRAEPDGAKALYESLRRLGKRSVHRNLEHPDKLHLARGETAVFLGASEYDFQLNEDLIRDFARDGAHIVLALDSRASRRAPAQRDARLQRRTFPTPGSTNTNSVVFHSRELFGVGIGVFGGVGTNFFEAQRDSQIAADSLPGTLPWYGRFYFAPPTNEWTSVYSVSNKPVVLRKKIGLGDVLLLGDSFPFSNESLRVDPQSEFLLWTFGSGKIVFDETHLGLQRGSGLAVLMREFRLHGLVAGCLLLVALWIWRSSSTLVPPNVSEAALEAESIEGKTAREAIVHLLRRNLTDVQVLRAGLDEWARMHPPRFYWQTVQLEEARQLVEQFAKSPRPRDLAAMQRKLSQHLYPNQNAS